MTAAYPDRIFKIKPEDFPQLALTVFNFQYQNNEIYRSFTDALGIDSKKIKTLAEIPFLPIGFYKTHTIQTTSFTPEIIFESSGTTQTTKSQHYVKDSLLYRRSFLEGFERFYGAVKDWCIIGLLPDYLERTGSSLVYMVEGLIKMSKDKKSGFYLHDHQRLFETLQQLEKQQQKTLLIGLSSALLDFSEKYQMKLKHTCVMETGGMKGKRKEIVRQELQHLLIKGFGVRSIHSEYGMTELLSQAYSQANGIFESPAWMRVLVRDEDDPFDVREDGGGILNIIDLANIYSCSFIATDDAGKVNPDGKFEVLGRVDNSDLRGCNLLVT
jgi:phenylacetate-coenzyme A ligase PaaK-like adenylate-forming protein